jgi:hypothetical protein
MAPEGFHGPGCADQEATRGRATNPVRRSVSTPTQKRMENLSWSHKFWRVSARYTTTGGRTHLIPHRGEQLVLGGGAVAKVAEGALVAWLGQPRVAHLCRAAATAGGGRRGWPSSAADSTSHTARRGAAARCEAVSGGAHHASRAGAPVEARPVRKRHALAGEVPRLGTDRRALVLGVRPPQRPPEAGGKHLLWRGGHVPVVPRREGLLQALSPRPRPRPAPQRPRPAMLLRRRRRRRRLGGGARAAGRRCLRRHAHARDCIAEVGARRAG